MPHTRFVRVRYFLGILVRKTAKAFRECFVSFWKGKRIALKRRQLIVLFVNILPFSRLFSLVHGVRRNMIVGNPRSFCLINNGIIDLFQTDPYSLVYAQFCTKGLCISLDANAAQLKTDWPVCITWLTLELRFCKEEDDNPSYHPGGLCPGILSVTCGLMIARAEADINSLACSVGHSLAPSETPVDLWWNTDTYQHRIRTSV